MTKEKIKKELKEMTMKNLALITGLGCFSILFIWTCIAISQGFFDTRIGLISPSDGPCVFENTRTASDRVMKGELVPVHVVNLHYGIGPKLTNGHLYTGDHIDVSAPPTGIKERFSFRATRSLFSTLASVRRGPEWKWTEVTTVASSVGTYEGHLWRQKITAEIDRIAERASALRYQA